MEQEDFDEVVQFVSRPVNSVSGYLKDMDSDKDDGFVVVDFDITTARGSFRQKGTGVVATVALLPEAQGCKIHVSGMAKNNVDAFLSQVSEGLEGSRSKREISIIIAILLVATLAVGGVYAYVQHQKQVEEQRSTEELACVMEGYSQEYCGLRYGN